HLPHVEERGSMNLPETFTWRSPVRLSSRGSTVQARAFLKLAWFGLRIITEDPQLLGALAGLSYLRGPLNRLLVGRHVEDRKPTVKFSGIRIGSTRHSTIGFDNNWRRILVDRSTKHPDTCVHCLTPNSMRIIDGFFQFLGRQIHRAGWK